MAWRPNSSWSGWGGGASGWGTGASGSGASGSGGWSGGGWSDGGQPLLSQKQKQNKRKKKTQCNQERVDVRWAINKKLAACQADLAGALQQISSLQAAEGLGIRGGRCPMKVIIILQFNPLVAGVAEHHVRTAGGGEEDQRGAEVRAAAPLPQQAPGGDGAGRVAAEVPGPGKGHRRAIPADPGAAEAGRVGESRARGRMMIVVTF